MVRYSCVKTLPRIPLIEDLTAGPIPPGSYLMVEFTGSSQWYNASLTMAAGWLKSGGRVFYAALAQPPERVRSQLARLELRVNELENEDRLQIWDGYSASLGQKSKEKFAVDSMKVSDISIFFSRQVMAGRPAPDKEVYGPEWLRIVDNESTIARFNDERAWIEFLLTRNVPSASSTRTIYIAAFIKGLHSERVYGQVEAAADGIIDLKLDESQEEARDLIRIRNMRNVNVDRRWHTLKISENLEISLERVERSAGSIRSNE